MLPPAWPILNACQGHANWIIQCSLPLFGFVRRESWNIRFHKGQHLYVAIGQSKQSFKQLCEYLRKSLGERAPPPVVRDSIIIDFNLEDEEGVGCCFVVSPSVALDDLVNEIKLKANLTSAHMARICMVGLYGKFDGKCFGPIQTQAEWGEVLSIRKGHNMQVYLPSAPIDFPNLEYSFAKSAAGAGGFGVVYRCMHMKTGYIFGAKVVSSNDADLDEISKEVSVMSRLNHKHIVSYLGTHKEGKGLRIFMEYCYGGSLRQALTEFDRFPEPMVQDLTYQILQAMDYLHSLMCVHRDIKPENILLDPKYKIVKLCDFGLSQFLHHEHQMKPCGERGRMGTPSFMAPEVISEGRYGHLSDIWAMGCTVLQMLCGGESIYNLTSPMAILYNVGHNKTKPFIPSWLSASTSNFLELCFDHWKSRPDASELLRHEFITQPISNPGQPNSAPSTPTTVMIPPIPHLPPMNCIKKNIKNNNNSTPIQSVPSIMSSDSWTTTFDGNEIKLQSKYFFSQAVNMATNALSSVDSINTQFTAISNSYSNTSTAIQNSKSSEKPVSAQVGPRPWIFKPSLPVRATPVWTSSLLRPAYTTEVPEERVPSSLEDVFSAMVVYEDCKSFEMSA